MNAAPIPPRSFRIANLIHALLVLVAAVFLALYALHLTADFPNHSPWMDWAKYTDEGWYGDAAIRHYLRGHWYVSGDFNPAAALPVWPVLELAVFHFAGVSLTAARALSVAVFGLTLIASYCLMRRWQSPRRSIAPAVAVLLLAANPFCYAFTRMAILEPLLILLTLLALLAASFATASLLSAGSRPSGLHLYLPTIALGILLPLMVLTKTTAVFLLPAIAWLLWASAGYSLRSFFRIALPAGAIAIALWASYFLIFVRPHFLEDYRYLFSANGYTGMTLANAWTAITDTLKDGLWLGRLLYPLSLAAIAAAFAAFRRRIPPLQLSLILWAAGYAAFLAYHNNLQPRYYLVLVVPLTLLIPLVIEELLARLHKPETALRFLVWTAVLLAIALPEAIQTLHYVRTQEYTFARAAAEVRQIVTATPSQSPLVLSISGSDLSLMTGLPSICDDFGTMDLPERVATYRPGWYVAWNDVEDDKMEALAPLYHLHRVAEFPVMDDPERNLLILYRLDPATSPPPPHRKRKPIPRSLQTRIGQQPSVTQLEH